MDDFKLLINGALVEGDATVEVINPATEEVLAQAPAASAAQMDSAVGAAKAAFPAWAAQPIEARRKALLSIADVVEANTDALARLLTLEQGKPLSQAVAEIGGTVAYFRYFATLDLPVEILEEDDTHRVEAHRLPIGVIGAIVPWNFPLALMAFKVPPALLAGNTVVLKPAATTPLSTLAFGRLIADVVPPGVVNVISDNNDLGGHLTAHPDVAKISFTGSTATGAKVMAGAADLIKRITLELGGNDAGIVLDDVDVKTVAPQLFAAAFGNSGQICIAMKRLYIHEAVYDALCDELVRLAEEAVVGDGLQQGTEFGPIQNRMQFRKVKALIEEARTQGRVVAGGTTVGEKGFFLRPTIVRDIEDGTSLVDEEQFGPVLPLIRFADESDALNRANASPYGLGGSVWSGNVDRAYALAKRMEAGTVWVNKHLDLAPQIPFGGIKSSGLGTELGEAGLHEYTQLKVINIALA